MPRAKVRPEDRKRSVQACAPCRASKVRCDSQQPCTGCKKRGKVSDCVYDAPYQQSHPRRISMSTRHTSEFESPVLPSVPVAVPEREDPRDTSTVDAGSSDEAWQPGSHQTQSRLLMSSKGEQLYLGGTASISYLHFLRHVLRRQMGPSPFTENNFNNIMLEVEPSMSVAEDVGDIDIEDKHALIQCFFESTSAILDLTSREEILEYLAAETLPNHDSGHVRKDKKAKKAILHMVFAIGGQCRGPYPSDMKFGSKCFSKAQRFAFEGFLCDPSLNMIRVFLLMAFYMLGACRRNAAFMYLGVASKAANALGLHRKDQYRLLSRSDGSERLRTWKSLCVLDTIVSSILGRPGNFSSVWHDDLESNTGSEREPRTSSVPIDASYEMSCLIDSMEQGLFSKIVETSSAEEFLQQLRKWSRKLPPELRRFSSTDMFISTPADRELLVGAAHVACIYHFAVILVTRPFLTSHIMLKLRERSRKSNINMNMPPTDTNEKAKIANLAQVCVESATYMATLARRAMGAGLLLRNMCLMKAWIFVSGLLLGFSLYAEEGEATETASALNDAREVLLYFSDLSPQSRHYHEILTNFGDAIDKSRQQRLDERKKMTNQFIDQIFTIDLKQGSGEPSYLSPDSGSMEMMPVGDNLSTEFDFDAAMAMPGFTVNDAANLPMVWDDFSADWPQLDGGLFFDLG